MTQQPYPPQQQPGYPPQQPPAGYPPQYPQQPQAPYAPQPQAPAYPQQPYAQPGYAPPQQPGYPPQQGYGQPPAQPQVPLAQGGLDEFYSQPTTGGGPGISWSDENGNQRPVGTTFIGVVTKDCGDADVSQITNREGIPQTFRDGRPKFQMKVPLKQVAMFDGQGNQVPLPQKFTEGEAVFYVKGQAREELTRAMAEAGRTGAPTSGSVISVQLVQRRGNGGGINPTNVVAVRYQPADSGEQAATPQVTPPPAAPAPQQTPQQVEQPPQWAQPQPQGQPQLAQVPVQQQPQGQPQYAPQEQQLQPPMQPAVVQQPAPQQPGYPPQVVPQQPGQQQGPPQGQPQFADPEQQALFDRIRQGQSGQPAA